MASTDLCDHTGESTTPTHKKLGFGHVQKVVVGQVLWTRSRIEAVILEVSDKPRAILNATANRDSLAIVVVGQMI
jgi:hypothetical protein